MTEGKIPTKTAEQRATLREKSAVRRHGDHTRVKIMRSHYRRVRAA